jgi:hypothetical protein
MYLMQCNFLKTRS